MLQLLQVLQTHPALKDAAAPRERTRRSPEMLFIVGFDTF
jgi:hypothetical protein